MRDILVLLLVLTVFKLQSCSMIINQSVHFCEVLLSNGDFDEFESKVIEFHECMATSKDIKLVLRNYSLVAFPNKAFSSFGQVNHMKVVVEENSRLHLLLPGLPGDELFQNSRFDSVTFDVSDLPSLMGWRWTVLADLEVSELNGFVFNAVRSKLVYLDSDFSKVAKGRVKAVRILKCQLRWLGKYVFAPFHHLKTLELRDNLIENIERSHLPASAPELRVLDLGNNRLKFLPDNFVDGLNLQTILLSENNLKISESQTQIILKSKNFPLLLGASWPCLCSEFSEISKIYGVYAKSVNCYKRDNDELFNYLETCSNVKIVDPPKYGH